MKTIKGPKDPSHFRITCNNENCEAVLEVTKKDMRLDATDPRENAAYVLKCPHCEKDTWIDSTVLDKFAVQPT